MLAQELRMEFDVARLVDTVNVTETSRNGEVRADLRKRAPDVVNIFGLSIKRVVVNIFIINTILFTACNTDFLLGKCQSDVTDREALNLPSRAIASLALLV